MEKDPARLVLECFVLFVLVVNFGLELVLNFELLELVVCIGLALQAFLSLWGVLFLELFLYLWISELDLVQFEEEQQDCHLGYWQDYYSEPMACLQNQT